ncbi:MAG: hypothetical protein ACI4RT_07025, partial [Candidatus Spyradenecus sp.]
MDTPSLTPLDSGLRCDAPAACPAPDQVRTFLNALETAPLAAPDFPLPAADQPATPETLRATLESLIATQEHFAQSVADFQEAAAPLLTEAPETALFLPKTNAPAASAPSCSFDRRWSIDEKAVAGGEAPDQKIATSSVAERALSTVDCPLSTDSVAPRPEVEKEQALPQGEVGPTSRSPRP